MQGVVMVVGVVILLGLALSQVGGLANATREVAKMVPPEEGVLRMEVSAKIKLPQGTWFKAGSTNQVQYFRVKIDTEISPAKEGGVNEVNVICLPKPTSAEATAIEKQLAQQSVPAIPFVYQKKSDYKYGAGKQGVYVSAPGPSSTEAQGFLPVMMAMCFFAFWPFAGSGQPSYMARQMAFKNTVTLRRAIVFVMVYFSLIYFPLIIIFTCGRVLLPGWEIDSDRIMPEMVMYLTSNAGAPWLAGLLLAAPFAAVMSSVDSFLLLFSSTITRDVYQQKHPDASEAKLKKVSYAVTIVMGVLAVLAMLKPPQFLQDLIVFGSGGLAASFLMPVVLMLYWPRLTPVATVAGMVSGGFTIGVIYLVGYFVNGKFGEINLLGLHPFIWAVAVSALVSVMAVRFSRPTDPELVEKYFGKIDLEEK
jgi:Na+/pantothenate symporter